MGIIDVTSMFNDAWPAIDMATMAVSIKSLWSEICSSFDIQETFSSVRDFLSSGYVLVFILGLFAINVVKFMAKLIAIAIVLGIIWLELNTGFLSGMFAEFLSFDSLYTYIFMHI